MKGDIVDMLIKVALAIGFVFAVTNPQVGLFCAQVVIAVGDFFVG